MVRAPKRITRKDLRRPDQFVTLTGKLLVLFRQHKTASFAASAVVIAVFLTLWGLDLYLSRQNRLGAQEYSHALALYHSGKHREALGALSRVGVYRYSVYSRLALLYQANSYIALKEPTKAVPILQQLLNKEKKDPFLRQLAFLTLGYAQERAGRCQESIQSFAAAEKLAGPFKEDAILGKGRCAAQNRDLKEALSSYRQYLASYPGSEKSAEIALRIQELEANLKDSNPGK